MQTISIEVYSFEELSKEAQSKAIENNRYAFEYAYYAEDKKSLTVFGDYFGVSLEYYTDAWNNVYFEHKADNSNFRGIKLKDIKRDNMPTGYCLDCALWETFYDEFKSTGNAKEAFSQALKKAGKCISEDINHTTDDEYIEEMLIVNEYQFTKDGKNFSL